jgi:predicted RecB family nuclease
MQKIDSALVLSASDLAGRLNCRHLTSLDHKVAIGELPRPQVWDPVRAALSERGAVHERNYVAHLKQAGLELVDLDPGKPLPALAAETLASMKSGAQVITQGAFFETPWTGRADVLLRVETPSPVLGGWSYEVVDTKLARETRGTTILQLCLYSDLLGRAQGRAPENMHVVAPWTDYALQSFRFASYAAYFRKARRELESSLSSGKVEDVYPDPKEHCDICRWRVECEARRRADDHLCLVAGISKVQISELQRRNVQTGSALARVPLPLDWKPERGAVASYERIREQARLQEESKGLAVPRYELLPVERGLGLAALPEPSRGDIFLDLEGDPFAGKHGIEYLFGCVYENEDGVATYRADWAFSAEDEKRAFQSFIDFALERWSRYPDLHIYHYAPYEPAALKRLMGRYATREEELDRMLRAERFVDLYQVTRNALRAGVESYSIKALEKLFGYSRQLALPDASLARSTIEASLELEETPEIDERAKQAVAAYNEDDCLSARALRGWLEQLRSRRIAEGVPIERPGAPEKIELSEERAERRKRIDALIARLTTDVPADPAKRSPEQHARWLLANLLDFNDREEKATWWELFRLMALSAQDLHDERAGITGLAFVSNGEGKGRTPVHRYSFPQQDVEVRRDDTVYEAGGREIGAVSDIHLEEGWIEIRKRKDAAEVHPAAIFTHKSPPTRKALDDSVEKLATYVVGRGMEGNGEYQAARDLLLRAPPSLRDDAPIRLPGESGSDAAERVAPLLQGGVFAIQGPPGTGKTYTGARMICALVKNGAKVGITANSHAVIRKLIEDTLVEARKRNLDIGCIVKPKEHEPDQPGIRFARKNADVFMDLWSGSAQVAAGTAWLWAADEARESVDVLIVDEAAQLSLAKVLAAAHAAKTLVLLGDPQQLEQPLQGTHPEGTDVSALDHIRGESKTLPPDKGLFLEETWRLHPTICQFTSELFYEGRLRSLPTLARQEVRSASRVKGSGLRYLPVPHEGNTSSSAEEVDAIHSLVREILGAEGRSSPATWIDGDGQEKPLGIEDILIIAPYNAQVADLQRKLPDARIGTVDRFQGQQAPIVIYSMTTSSHADAPRGMNFLYSLNRLNVATSRARCLCILVSSPRIFEPECRTPAQLEMANAFCRYLELAETIG